MWAMLGGAGAEVPDHSTNGGGARGRGAGVGIGMSGSPSIDDLDIGRIEADGGLANDCSSSDTYGTQTTVVGECGTGCGEARAGAGSGSLQ